MRELTSHPKMAPFSAMELKSGWEFKQVAEPDDAWLPVAKVPTNVHLDLMDNRRIPDPFKGFNEIDCEWVADKAWSYRVKLPETSRPADNSKTCLAFDGLDTFAKVKLNGEVIQTSDNMFIPYRVDVSEKLKPGPDNILQIDFASARIEALKIQAEHPDHKYVGFNGDMSRLTVRKAQYHWGWDWGPILMPCGPWRPVRIETYHARISHLRIDYDLMDDLKVAAGTVTAYVEGGTAGVVVAFEARLGDKVVMSGTSDISAVGQSQNDFLLHEPELWYPYLYGKQPLYDFEVKVLGPSDEMLCSDSRRVGFRKIDLVQEPDEHGQSFYFRINEVDIFCGGSNWIPADSFTPRVTAEKYRKWLKMIIDGYQTMIRVWGGGIFEDDVFYDTCDEMGILVWQDFLFGCGNYPTWPKILDSIHEEVVANLRRLRHHPSVVIFAGNNEDYQVQESAGLTYNYEDKDPHSWLKTDFPARYIYEKLLPDAMMLECPNIPYHPGSPWGDGLPTADQRVGDMHQWNVWHGTQEKYQIYDTLGGRFNSEFGMEAFPHIDTIKWYCTDKTQLYPQSRMIDFHNKADGHERRIATYLVENFRTVTDLEGFIHLTQLSQAEALMFGYRGWRRQWGKNRLCGGALVWQLNDCWPVASWSIVDYFQRKKPAYYTMRRVLAPLAVAVKRDHHDWSRAPARPVRQLEWELWVSSSLPLAESVMVELRFISIATGADIKPRRLKEIEIAPNSSTDVMRGILDNETEEQHVLASRILQDGRVLSRDIDWPQPLKYIDLSERGVEVIPSADMSRVTVRSARPTKGLVFEEREGVLVDDSALDIVPGDEHIIQVRGLKKGNDPLKWRFLGQ